MNKKNDKPKKSFKQKKNVCVENEWKKKKLVVLQSSQKHLIDLNILNAIIYSNQGFFV